MVESVVWFAFGVEFVCKKVVYGHSDHQGRGPRRSQLEHNGGVTTGASRPVTLTQTTTTDKNMRNNSDKSFSVSPRRPYAGTISSITMFLENTAEMVRAFF